MTDGNTGIFLLAGVAMFTMGIHSIIAQSHLLRRILALNVMASGVFFVFMAIAARARGPIPDPVPHAMVLTGIVVSVCATGLALVLAIRVHEVGCAGGTEDEGHGAMGAKRGSMTDGGNSA